MKKYKSIILGALLIYTCSFISCGDDFLISEPTENQEAGAAVSDGALLSNLASAYQILLFDSYANQSFNAVLLMSDLRSDDIFKGGGDAGDQSQLYKLSQFSSTSAETLNGLWSIYFTGLARCNNVIVACDNAVNSSQENLKQYRAEASFLRAYYLHLLWKYWGNIPYFDKALNTRPYMAKQLQADEIYEKIMEDLDVACQDGVLPMKSIDANLGKASRAAALMLKARVVLYQKDLSRYEEITKDMSAIIQSNEYRLMADFKAIWLDENEFNDESIFETNQLPEGKIWANGWIGYGTNLPAFISPNGLSAGDKTGDFKGGWGFAPVRPTTYAIYEDGDSRREGSINKWDNTQYTARFQDTGLFLAKYAARVGYNPQGDVDLNYCNNLRIFRYAETLLNYAELVIVHGQTETGGISAENCLNQIRKRAFGVDNNIIANVENIKLERRKEFVGEGMRFWDLVRWGDASTILTENIPEYNSIRKFEEWMKYLPIPQEDMEKTKGTDFELIQNGQWN